MKTANIFLIAISLLFVCTANAQDIAVQTPTNTTVIYHDINLALYNAPTGSTVFLPAGIFTASDTVKIRKQLTIVGVGHRSDTPGGNTQIIGSLSFLKGSDGSSLMGVYLTKNVNIAISDEIVNNITVKYCNIGVININGCEGTAWGTSLYCREIKINQNYIRGSSYLAYSDVYFTNNICSSIHYVQNGFIANNIVIPAGNHIFGCLNNTTVRNNIFVTQHYDIVHTNYISNCDIRNNIFFASGIGENQIRVSDWNEIFIAPNDYHLKSNIGKNAGTDGTDIGIYGGTGFSDTALPPYPQITFKNVPGQTDEYGNLKIQVKVRAQ